MTPNKPRNAKQPIIAGTAALFAAMTVIAFAMPTAAQNENSEAEIDVEFTPDGLGFNVTSSKGISNVVVEYCDGETHKHEGEVFSGEVKFWNHTETQVVVAVYVKSGSEGEQGTGPKFTNEDADCGEIPFFSTGTALVLGTVGALGGAFLVMRRRK